jgi:hypothetical protein
MSTPENIIHVLTSLVEGYSNIWWEYLRTSYMSSLLLSKVIRIFNENCTEHHTCPCISGRRWFEYLMRIPENIIHVLASCVEGDSNIWWEYHTCPFFSSNANSCWFSLSTHILVISHEG